MDDLFGVTSSKQAARNFSRLATVNDDDLLEDGESFLAAKEEARLEEDPQWALFEISRDIRKNIRAMQGLLRKQTTGKRIRNRQAVDDVNSPEAAGTTITAKRKDKGYTGRTDEQESLSDAEKQKGLEDILYDSGIAETQEEAGELAAISEPVVLSTGLKSRA